MAQYIDKSALIAEIERRMQEHHSGYLVCLKDILSLLDTFETKEVGEPSNDLEEAAKFYAATHTEFFDSECKPHVAPAFIAGAEWYKEQLKYKGG